MSEEHRKHLQFDQALVQGQWLDNPIISIDDLGRIGAVRTDSDIDPWSQEAASPKHQIQRISGAAIPGMVNCHSHAFQRAFVGLSEYRTATHDSFWTWRKLMYQFVQTLTPEDVHSIAKRLYRQLLAGGYTWVTEFQYLHHSENGNAYADPACMSHALIQAAKEVGIGICILPVLYQRSGFLETELDPAQRRFACSNDGFLDILSLLHNQYASDPNVQVGMAFHSLRAVSIQTIQRIASQYHQLHSAGVIHIHVAEQQKEVDDCLAATGQRPIAFLLGQANVDRRWCLIHATQCNDQERSGIIKSTATVGLCPTTEANLGDGVFGIASFMAEGGRFAIGSDSNVCTQAAAELRLLEYTQRLLQRKRAILGTQQFSVGRNLYQQAVAGGQAAMGRAAAGPQAGGIQVGQSADLVILRADDLHQPEAPAPGRTAALQGDRILDRYLFDQSQSMVQQTFVAGKLVWTSER